MTLPVTINFPAGLRPDQYSDIVAISEDRQPSRAVWLQGDLAKARAALSRLAMAVGTPATAVYGALSSDDHEECNNYEALLAVVEARLGSGG